MSITPIITFKAGICDVDSTSKPYKIKSQPQPGYIYLYADEDLIHFCWRPRDKPLDEPELDLNMVPSDGHFVPYDTRSPQNPTSKTNGRIFVLKFSSSSQRYIFWLQSKPQGRTGDPAWLSPRDLKIGEIVDRLLQGEEVNVNRELASVRRSNNDDSRRDDDNDETMEDAEGRGNDAGGTSGGAGPDATGGDVREEGEDAREGGADGARAAAGSAPGAVADVVRNLLESLKGTPDLTGARSHTQGKLYPLLNDLLETSITVPMVDTASDDYVDSLLNFLPPAVLVLAHQGDDAMDEAEAEPSAESAAAARVAMSSRQKRDLLKQVLRSPQFSQSLASLTVALRDGGLPSIAEALGVHVQNAGFIRGGSVPLGGGEAVEAFVEGVKKTVQRE